MNVLAGIRRSACLAVACAIPATLWGGARGGEPQVEPDFAQAVVPFLKKHCLECHEGENAEGELDLSQQLDEQVARASFDDWDYLRERVLDGDMPPRSRARPGGAETESFLAWIDHAHGPIDPRFRPLDPGAPVLRRLNSTEYANSVRALTGVDFPAREFFPSDAVGYGFDHIGASLSLPDALFEKYLEAAEQIADQVILRWSESDRLDRRFGAAELQGRRSGGAIALYTKGETTAQFSTRHAGEYLLGFEAFGSQAGDEACKMQVAVNGRVLQTFDVAEERGEAGEFSVRAKLQAGHQLLEIRFINDYYDPEHPQKDRRDRNLFVVAASVAGPANAPEIGAFQRELETQFPESLGRKRIAAVIEHWMELAWRRPVTKSEVARLVKSLPSRANFATQCHHALISLLVSPPFLFRMEADEHDDARLSDAQLLQQIANAPSLREGVRALDSWEVATRLAYFLTSGPPDAMLRARASADELLDPAVLRAEVDRILAAPASGELMRNFAGQWLQLRNLERISIDESRFPAWTPSLRWSMEQETLLFFEALLHEDRDLRELLEAPFTYVNEELAAHYGMDGVRGEAMQRVELNDARRSGLLGQASILTLTSNPTRTSPVKRGKWILDNLLGSPPPPPPPDAGGLDESQAEHAADLREQLAIHRARPSCAVCHDAMDALGLGLENYDPIGGWRESDGGKAIDASGELPDGARFSQPGELRAILRDDPALLRTVTEKLLIYALGRGLERSDRAIVQQILAKLDPEHPTLRAILHGIVESPAFRLRRPSS